MLSEKPYKVISVQMDYLSQFINTYIFIEITVYILQNQIQLVS